ncbi:hypothetical protein HD600_002784 [Microbacterium ginsengiterrae]|uniref:DUF2017 domain-containing protein n=1 Tax=Microbacterium ginsengiterrae TaxID=546115 RepID=A0A7W9CFJ7_9MICO|nr:hypothetical protein [Microbacterium ginsengiterrae]
MTERSVIYRLARIEIEHLLGLVDDLMTVIEDADQSIDPAVERLVPSPYPDDVEATLEFSSATRDDLLDRRTADAAVVRRALLPLADEAVPGPPEADQVSVSIPQHDMDAWLRTLTALRLVIATRLGITDDDEHDAADVRFGVYDWLAYRLDGLIAIADAMDEDPGPA